MNDFILYIIEREGTGGKWIELYSTTNKTDAYMTFDSLSKVVDDIKLTERNITEELFKRMLDNLPEMSRM